MSSTSVDARVDTGAAAGAPPGGAAKPHHTPHRWWVLAVIGIAQLMVVLDATIVNIALPTAQKDLAFTNDGRQWIVTAYSLAFGSLLLLGGRLADLFGRRTTFLIGLVGFGAASALGGAANGFTMLVIARALQGLFGAILAPSAMSLLTTTFTDPKERSKAFAIFGSIAGSGGAIGLLLGGLLTEHLNWRWTLYVNVVIAVFAVAGAVAFLRKQPKTARPKLDLLGTFLVAAGLFCIVYGFSNAETHHWGNWMTWGFLAAGGVLIALFVAWQTRAKHPLLPLRVLADRNRSGAYITVFISGAGMFGVFLFLTYYLQQTLGYSPVKTGLAFLPMIGMLMAFAQVSMNFLLQKLGPKPVVPVGMGMAAGGLVWLTALDATSSYAPHVLPPLLLLGAGLGLAMPSAMSLATLGVRPQDQGVASATVNTMQQVGGSIGTALFNTMAATAATHYATDHFRDADVKVQAAIHSYSTAYWWAAGFFAAGLVIAALLYRAGKPMAMAPKVVEDADASPVAVPAPASDGDTAAMPVAAAAGTAVAAGGSDIHGRVLAGTVPVAQAAVTLVAQDGRQLGRTVSKADGRYGLDVPEVGNYLLVGSAAGHQPQVATVRAGGAVPVEFDLLLGGSGALAGTVSGADGAPVPGAVVVVTDAAGEVAGSATAGPDGAFRVPELLPGAYTLTVSAEGHRPSAGPVDVEAGGPTRRDAELRPAAALRGTVTGPDESPVRDALVTLLDPAGNVVSRHATGTDGVYAFTDLTGGEYTVVATGYPPQATTATVTGDGSDRLDVVLRHEEEDSAR